MKVKIDSLLNLTKRQGVAAAEEFAAFVSDQIYAIKQTVEREGLDCEFELRRSFDVFQVNAEADFVRKQFRESLQEGLRWTRERDLIEEDMVQQVS